MCGITGFVSTKDLDFKSILTTMVVKMNHRGPDSSGVWFNDKLRVGFGHARLSIVDLSKAGHQPMLSHSGRFCIVFNGEIYNHLDIRNELNKVVATNWRGTSDTETITEAIAHWGMEKTIQQCVGMFAFALLDIEEETLTLVRDRMGEKPLYYGWVNDHFVFGSELNAIKSFPLFNNAINRNALMLYMRHASIPEPYSIYENIFKLGAGCLLTLQLKNNSITHKQYWSTEKLANENHNTFHGSAVDAVDKLEELLSNSIGIQMMADVPLGAFLSGGVDSSTIVALMQRQSESKINTFTIGFEEKEYNEAEHAKKIANHLGTNHHEVYISANEVLDIVPQISKIYAEPFSESSQIPTFLVSKIAKREVTVSLSGDAGDELFCGYNRYQLANSSWNKIEKIPSGVRSLIANSVQSLPYNLLKTLLLPVKGKTNSKGIEINAVDKLLKASELLKFKNRKQFYSKGFMTHNLEAENWILGSVDTKTAFETNKLQLGNYFEEMMAVDLLTYLPNNNLPKVDRAAMANSLETRVPLLDHRIVEFALSLPMEFKIREGVDKWVLRQVLYKHVPKSLIERPKMGFGVPLGMWLRGPLKEWCENLISQKRLDEEGFFNSNIVRTKWEEHLSGKRNWENQLWDVMVFQSWLDEQKMN